MNSMALVLSEYFFFFCTYTELCQGVCQVHCAAKGQNCLEYDQIGSKIQYYIPLTTKIKMYGIAAA